MSTCGRSTGTRGPTWSVPHNGQMGDTACSGVSLCSSFFFLEHQSRRSRENSLRPSFSATVVSWATHPTNSHEKRLTSFYDASPGGKDTWTV